MANNEVETAMMRFEYFHKWNKETIAECCSLAKIEKYNENVIILGEGIGFPNYVYFVLNGRCKIIEELYVEKFKINNNPGYKLYERHVNKVTPSPMDIKKTDSIENKPEYDTTSNTSSGTTNIAICPRFFRPQQSKLQVNKSKKSSYLPPNVEVHFVQVCILNPLSCFGFGEAMDRRMVVTTEPTECLLIPHYWLTQQTLNNLWNKIGIFLRRHIPSTEYVFKEFVNQRKWLKHREELVEQILFTKKRTSNNQISNVPYFLRIGKNIDSY